MIQADEIERLFTRSDGSYLFARWGRPIVPVVIGVDDASLSVFKGALGVNLMVFVFKAWGELLEVPKLDALVPGLVPLVNRLRATDANQYRFFRFDADGAIKAAFVFLRMDKHMEAVSADTLALSQAAQTIVLWSDEAFKGTAPIATLKDRTVLRPEIAQVIQASYDVVMPVVARDPSHALRVAARIGPAT